MKDKRIKFSKVIIVVVLVQVFLYTWVHLILSAIIGMEITPTTSVAFYTFCGAEAGLLAFIRKINKQSKEDEEPEDDGSKQEEEPYERDL
jgi:hypothetical protein